MTLKFPDPQKGGFPVYKWLQNLANEMTLRRSKVSFTDVSEVFNTVLVSDVLKEVRLPKNHLTLQGQTIRWISSGQIPGIAANSTLEVRVNATIIFNTTVVVGTSANWRTQFDITFIDPTSARVSSIVFFDFATLTYSGGMAIDWTQEMLLQIYGSGGGFANQISCNYFKVEWLPAGVTA